MSAENYLFASKFKECSIKPETLTLEKATFKWVIIGIINYQKVIVLWFL